MMSPYQEVASGFDNEKFNGDYGASGVALTSTPPAVTFDKTGPVSIAAGANATYSLSATNTGTTGIGLPSQGLPFVFEDAVPTASNAAQWATHWVPAQRIAYNDPNKRYDGQFTVVSNTAPFTVGKPAYIWGFQTGAASSEWILFRDPNWTWPAPNPMNPFGVDWNAATASAVIGSIHADGSPFLMKSAAVTTWQQWRDAELASEALNGVNDDPDRDGQSNLIEFVFGSPPRQAGAPLSAPVEIVTSNSQRFQQITLPRRVDRLATLTVEVLPNLTSWAAGSTATAVISDTPAALVVRDLTPLGSGAPMRFMRLKAEVPD